MVYPCFISLSCGARARGVYFKTTAAPVVVGPAREKDGLLGFLCRGRKVSGGESE